MVFQDKGLRLVALDEASGGLAWAYPWEAVPLAVADDLLYVATGGTEIHVIDPRSGRPERCFPCPHAEAASVAGACLLVQRPVDDHGRRSLVCLERESGRRRWSRVLPPDQPPPVPIAIGQGVIAVGQGDGCLVALELSTGDERWRRSWPEWGYQDGERLRLPSAAPLFFVDDRLLAEVSMKLIALDSASGASAWQVEGSAPRFHDDRLYSASSLDYEVRSAGSGRIALKTRLGEGAPKHVLHDGAARVAVVTEAHVVVNMGYRPLLAVHRATGAYAWHHERRDAGAIEGEPVLASGRLYYRTHERLFCLGP